MTADLYAAFAAVSLLPIIIPGPNVALNRLGGGMLLAAAGGLTFARRS